MIDLTQVVVVNAKLDVRVSSTSSVERDGNELIETAENAGEDGVTGTTVLVEDLVDNIPLGDLAWGKQTKTSAQMHCLQIIEAATTHPCSG